MQRSSHLVSIYVIGQRDCRGGKGFSPSTFSLPHARTHTYIHMRRMYIDTQTLTFLQLWR